MNATAQPSLAVLIADTELRQKFESVLSEEYLPRFFVSINEFIEHQSEGSYDLILCEQQLLESQQAVNLAALKTAHPKVQILVIGPSRPIETQIAALRHGARGYFDSALSPEKLLVALHSILHGEVWVERHVIADLIDELTHVPEISEQQRVALETLSPKELEVAKLVSHGATNKMIANKMAITERTVKAHLTTIFHKMDLPDRLSLAIFFRDLR